MAMRRNVLVVHQAALGDFVLCWPVVLAAARLFPQSRLFVATHAQKGRLAERALGVESIDIESGFSALHADAGPVPDAVLQAVGNAHTIVSFVSDRGGAWRRRTSGLNPEARILEIAGRPPDGFARHAHEHLLDALAEAPALRSAAEQMMRHLATNGLGKWRGGGAVLLHPGSGARGKCWPVERFVDLASRLRRRGIAVDVALGEAEQERLSADERGALLAASTLRATPTLLDLLSAICGCRAYIGNDAGPTHLAAALGAPTLAIFGPSDERVWRPVGPRTTLLKRDPLGDLPVDEVEAALAPLLATERVVAPDLSE